MAAGSDDTGGRAGATRGRSELEPIVIGAVVGFGGLLTTLTRLVIVWMRSRHPRNARMRVGGRDVTLDLSDPNEAAEYLERLQKRTDGGI